MSPVVPISVADYLSLVNLALHTIPEGAVVEGEVAEYKVSHGKWITFLLKDEKAEAVLPCFATTYGLSTPLADGMRVRVTGSARVREAWGKFSLSVETVELVGEGALQKAYEMLKKKLTDEGLFDIARKRALPRFPNTIGLITSREAAAYGDFLRILGNRMGGVTVLFAPVHVQGQNAVPEILDAFAHFDALSEAERPQMVVLSRGGGSLEDLQAFNDERVVRAVFASRIPVVVGVGHERDETLCDFAADVRASTPSNAAERAVPDRRELLREIVATLLRVEDRLRMTLDRAESRCDRAVSAVDSMFVHAMTTRRASVVALERVLASVDPSRVLDRGYAIVRSRGKLVTSPSVPAGTPLTIRVKGGELNAEVAGKIRQERLL